ncbi:MAG TPA: serine/threonine-protein kinase [Gemmatimonadaceae bacterium]|nr:serine/threonine-protein kinase [Gemmatimonadaceae bacterium]
MTELPELPSGIDTTFVAFQEALAGRYSLERELGRGGMGVVYLAREVRLDRQVAIKLLPPELGANATLRDRFLREARTAARLSHPYIVPIHSVDEVGPYVFYVMAYVDGETLAERVHARGPLPAQDVTRILREVAWALAYAHAQGVIHRDIKPANILLEGGTARAMVLDFGIARLANVTGHTEVGQVLGTPEYMSPEQACGEAVDGRSDLYSLGIVGYYALSGALPFTGGPQEVLAQQVTKAPPPLSGAARAVPRALANAIEQCLAKDPAQRFATGEALADALAPALERRGDLPVPLRVFLDRRRMAVVLVPAALGMSVLSSLIAQMSRGGVTTPHLALAIVVGAFTLVAPFGVVIGRLRQLLRHGYGADDIVAAFRTSFQRQREEFQYEFGNDRSAREKAFRAAAVLGFGVAGGAALAAVGGVVMPGVPLAPIAIMGLYFGIFGMVVSARWRRLREGGESRFARFWESRVGRALVRVAGFRLGARAVPSDRPTELGIAMSAEALYDSFPKDTRKALGDVPGVLHGLETHARAIRVRIESLDASIAEAQRASPHVAAAQDRLLADLRAARGHAEQRLQDVVTALETLRLDMLRLRAGAGGTDSITLDLQGAQELSADVDRLLAGAGEVRRALR